MIVGEGFRIRPPRAADAAAVYAVCFETGWSAEEIATRRPSPGLLGDVWAGPYLAHAPEWCRVVVDADGVAGYLLAVPDTAAFERWEDREWWPRLRAEHPLDDPGLSSGDRAVVERFADPPVAPERVAAAFPAHLHIDLLARARGRGLARRLIDDLVDRLGAAGVPAVHLGVSTTNTNAIGLYDHLGFAVLQRDDVTVWMGRRAP